MLSDESMPPVNEKLHFLSLCSDPKPRKLDKTLISQGRRLKRPQIGLRPSEERILLYLTVIKTNQNLATILSPA